MKSENRDILLKWIVALAGLTMLLLSVWLYSTERAYKVTVFLGVEYQEPQEYQIQMMIDGEKPKVFCHKDSTRPGISRYEDESGFWLRLSVTPQEYRSWDAYEIHYQTDKRDEKTEVTLAGNEQGGKNTVSFYDSSIRSRYNVTRYIYLLFGGFCFILTLFRLRKVKRSPSQEYILEVMDREKSADPQNPMWKETGNRFASLYTEQCRPGAYAAAAAEAYRSGRFLEMSLGKEYVYHINIAAALSAWGRAEESLKYQSLFWKETKERTKKKWCYVHYHNIRRINYWRLGDGEAVLKERELIWSFMETHEKAEKVRAVKRSLDMAKVMADITEKRWREARDGVVVLLEGAQTEWERLQLYDMMVVICRESGDDEGRQRYEKLLLGIDREPGTARFSGLEPETAAAGEYGEGYTTASIRNVNRTWSALVVLGILLLVFLKY